MLLRDLVSKAFKISKSEAARQIESGSIRFNGACLTKDKNAEILYVEEDKKWFIKGILSESPIS